MGVMVKKVKSTIMATTTKQSHMLLVQEPSTKQSLHQMRTTTVLLPQKILENQRPQHMAETETMILVQGSFAPNLIVPPDPTFLKGNVALNVLEEDLLDNHN